ncbi:MAG: DUF928 domain-containing protein [Scytolyngbya sp. HA4215-MV1]|nr:DUF928 domain-containing protein [Scytolyngbya sp. HA4215-MV1]
MARIRLFRSVVFLSAVMLLQATTLVSFASEAQSVPTGQATVGRRRSRVTFKPPQGQALAPRKTIGGGRRGGGECLQSSANSITENLHPLLPAQGPALTVSEHPTFLVYVPSTSAKLVEFTLLSPEGDGLYQSKVNLTGSAGVVRFSLPKTEPALELNKDYSWIVSLACQPDGPEPGDPFVEGVVRRIQPNEDLITNLKQAKLESSLAQIATYSDSGIWYEAAADLANLQAAKPHDAEIKQAWQDLLQSVGLEAIASAPLEN